MSEQNCNHDCSSCGSNCASRTAPQSLKAPVNQYSDVRRVIAVVSGKGGVGKSLVTSSLAVQASREGLKTGILDADITGPSIPKAFGLNCRAEGNDMGLYPAKTAGGIKVMSVNLLLPDTNDPVVWRGPIIANMVKQFWTDVIWDDLDVLFIDMPPGTGDVPLTVFQSIPVDGIIIVTSPQELVSMIVEKAVRMAETMNIPILGIVENLSGFRCPDCGAVHEVFGHSNIEEIAAMHGIEHVERVPIDPQLAALCDLGSIEQMPEEHLAATAKMLSETK